MRTSNHALRSIILAIIIITSLVASACGATPTATPVPPTATKAAVPATAAPAPATQAAPTATKAPVATVAPTAAPTKVADTKTLIWGSSTGQKDLNPFRATGTQTMRAFRFTHSRLIVLDENNKAMPDLAESYTVSADGKTYTFKLRKGVLWQDDQPLSTKDVLITFLWHCTKDIGSTKYTQLKNIVGCQDVFDGKSTTLPGVTAPDDSTIVINVTMPDPVFAFAITDVVIMPEHVLSKIKPADFAKSDFVAKRAYPGTGPYIVKSFTNDEIIEWVANPKYFRGAPKIAGIIEKKIPDANTRMLAFEKGEIDIMDGFQLSDYDRAMKLPGVTALPFVGTIQAWSVNYHNLPEETDPKFVAMRTPQFRQALAYAVDWASYANIRGAGKSDMFIRRTCYWTDGVFGMGTCSPELNTYAYNLDKAKSLLKEIGWDSKWILEYVAYGSISAADEAVQQMWGKAGLNVNLRPVDPASWGNELRVKRSWDIYIGGLAPNANMVEYYSRFRCGNYYDVKTCPACYNDPRYCNPEYDKLAAQALVAPNAQAAEPLMLQMTKILNNDLPMITVGMDKTFRMVSSRLDGKTVKVGSNYCWEDIVNWSWK